MKRLLLAIIAAALAIVATGCISITGDTTYAGTYVSNQKDSKALNISGSNGTNAIREAEGSAANPAGDTEQTDGTRTARGAQVVLAGQNIDQQKTADTRAVASLQAGNKAAGASGGDQASTTTDGGGTNVSPNLNATGQGTASSGDATNSADGTD